MSDRLLVFSEQRSNLNSRRGFDFSTSVGIHEVTEVGDAPNAPQTTCKYYYGTHIDIEFLLKWP